MKSSLNRKERWISLKIRKSIKCIFKWKVLRFTIIGMVVISDFQGPERGLIPEWSCGPISSQPFTLPWLTSFCTLILILEEDKSVFSALGFSASSVRLSGQWLCQESAPCEILDYHFVPEVVCLKPGAAEGWAGPITPAASGAPVWGRHLATLHLQEGFSSVSFFLCSTCLIYKVGIV